MHSFHCRLFSDFTCMDTIFILDRMSILSCAFLSDVNGHGNAHSLFYNVRKFLSKSEEQQIKKGSDTINFIYNAEYYN